MVKRNPNETENDQNWIEIVSTYVSVLCHLNMYFGIMT